MSSRCLLYYITDRSSFPGDEGSRREYLLRKIAEAADAGVDYIQLREKDLSVRELESLAGQAMDVIGRVGDDRRTILLINSRIDVALAVSADGVHLRSEDISPKEVRSIWETFSSVFSARKISPQSPVISVSCHSPAYVSLAVANGGTLALFAPVFGKKHAPEMGSTGIEALGDASRRGIPVLALGGVTLQNAAACLRAGASGIAGIRLFQENDVHEVVRALREFDAPA